MNPDQLKFKLTAVFEPAPEGGFTAISRSCRKYFPKGKPWMKPGRTCGMRLNKSWLTTARKRERARHRAQCVKNSNWPPRETARSRAPSPRARLRAGLRKAATIPFEYPTNGKVAPIPRHREIKEGTARAVCRAANWKSQTLIAAGRLPDFAPAFGFSVVALYVFGLARIIWFPHGSGVGSAMLRLRITIACTPGWQWAF